jgi:hypothetical protein
LYGFGVELLLKSWGFEKKQNEIKIGEKGLAGGEEERAEKENE